MDSAVRLWHHCVWAAGMWKIPRPTSHALGRELFPGQLLLRHPCHPEALFYFLFITHWQQTELWSSAQITLKKNLFLSVCVCALEFFPLTHCQIKLVFLLLSEGLFLCPSVKTPALCCKNHSSLSLYALLSHSNAPSVPHTQSRGERSCWDNYRIHVGLSQNRSEKFNFYKELYEVMWSLWP